MQEAYTHDHGADGNVVPHVPHNTIVAVANDSEDNADDSESEGDPDDDVNVLAAVPVTPSVEQTRELETSWLANHPDWAWVAPPHTLANDLRHHLSATFNRPIRRQDFSRLPTTVRAYITDHGRISTSRKLWLKRLLRYAGHIGTREIMPDGDELHAVLVRAHLGHNGRAHIIPSSMRRVIKKSYMLPPGEQFYSAWVALCPGCSWPN